MIEENLNYYRKDIIKLTIPVFFELLISSLFGMVDMMMVGNSGLAHITTPSIAAVGITNQVILIGIAMAQAISTGGTAMISRYIGAGEEEKIPDVIKHLLFLIIVALLLPFLLLNLLRSEDIMKFIGAEAQTIRIGLPYFKIIVVGFMFQAINLGIFASMRGAGNTRLPMVVNICVNLLNVFGNYILIFGKLGMPKLGVIGAGVSTSISHLVASLILLTILFKKSSPVRLDLKSGFRLKRGLMKNLIKIGGPAAVEQVGFRLGVVIFIKIVASLGTVVYATHQIASNIISLSFAPGQSFGIAAATLVGRSLGEKDLKKADIFIREINRISIMTSVVFAVIFYFFGPNLVGLYTKDPKIIEESAIVMKIIAFIQPFQASSFAISGGLRGAGDTVSTLMVTIVGVIVVRLTLAYLFINIIGLGIAGAWLAMFFDQLVRWIGMVIRYRAEKWKHIKLE